VTVFGNGSAFADELAQEKCVGALVRPGLPIGNRRKRVLEVPMDAAAILIDARSFLAGKSRPYGQDGVGSRIAGV
jgi:hypothetical protein